jgi:uncharacterized protein (DUF305 family)
MRGMFIALSDERDHAFAVMSTPHHRGAIHMQKLNRVRATFARVE